jgi:pre-60S factor REI1
MAEFDSLEGTSKCNTCKSCFASIDKIKEHYKSGWHILNSKRRANGLFPLKKSEYKALGLQTGKSTTSSIVGQREKEVFVVEKSETIKEEGEDGEEEVEMQDKKPTKAEPVPPEIAANISIFDDKKFETVDECVQYMATAFGFFIPDIEYLVDLEGFLVYLNEKVKLGGYCLYCQKIFTPGKPCQDHMHSKSHCKLQYVDGVDLEEYEDFYDFSASYEDEEFDVNEDGEVEGNGMSIASTGELVLADGRVLGHRDFRVYYKQHYAPADTRAPILAQQKEELLRLGGKFGGLTFNADDVDKMEDTQIMSMLVKYHKEIRKGVMVEQRAQRVKDSRNQRLETASKNQKMVASEVTTKKIRDYHGMLT